ncbi:MULTISPECIES: Gfo/Idh/MocA family protein [unclassified Microbacterium]|uniref:Gfo/Idh/MocA family protein n=1 Tax=unclassified Microbacterium TaxID=2609290 RepID=UPI00386BB8D0
MTYARWAILGAGDISGFFARALPDSDLGRLHAVGARDVEAARAFASAHGAPVAGTYDEILARSDIDAVYVGTVHSTHVELVLAALDAGKAVLCEKPLGVDPIETDAALFAADVAGLPLVEAFKYRFGPFPDALRDLIGSGGLGRVTEVSTSIGFTAATRTGRLFDPAVAGGAILDAGCYPVSLAVGVAAWAGGDVASARVVTATGTIGETGVDVVAAADLDIDGVRARVRTAIVQDLPRSARITGTAGTLEIENVWGSRFESTSVAVLVRPDGTREPLEVATVSPMAAEADAVIRALREGRTEAPEMPWAETRATARLLAEWRAALG